jgi:hypothetical protein
MTAFESQIKDVCAAWWKEGESATIYIWDAGQHDQVNRQIADVARREASPRSKLQRVALVLLRNGLASLTRASPDIDDLHFIIEQIRSLNAR